MSYGQGRQQGQQQTGPAVNELWAGPATGSAASRASREWAMGRAGDRDSSKQSPHGMSYGQGRRQGQQQAGPAGNELWAGPATGSAARRAHREWAMGRAGDRVSSKQGQQGMDRAGDRVSSKQGPQGMSYGQGRQQYVTSRVGSRQGQTSMSWAAREQASSNAHSKQMRY